MVEQELISKKDLLLETGISYGQLYRWKRKGLIPEDWFVRRSTFSGTETFFPRDKMLARVEKILSLKDGDVSLSQIADAVAPDLGEVSLTPAQALDRGLVTQAALDALSDVMPKDAPLRVGHLLAARIHDALLGRGDASVDEGKLLVRVLEEGYQSFDGSQCDLLFVRKAGVSTALLVTSSATVVLESGAKMVAREHTQDHIDEIASRLDKNGV